MIYKRITHHLTMNMQSFRVLVEYAVVNSNYECNGAVTPDDKKKHAT